MKNSMNRGTWWAMVVGEAKSWTQLSTYHFLDFLRRDSSTLWNQNNNNKKWVWIHWRGREELSIVGSLPRWHYTFTLYYKAIVIKTVCYCHENGHIGQWKNWEPPNKSPHMQSTNIWQGGQQHSVDEVSQWFWESWITTCRKIGLLSYTIHKNYLEID